MSKQKNRDPIFYLLSSAVFGLEKQKQTGEWRKLKTWINKSCTK
jgi:hypothetical protein